MYSHDPDDDFVEAAASCSETFNVLIRRPGRPVRSDPASDEMPCLIVTRASEPGKSLLDPIRLDEWLGYLQSSGFTTSL
jgi:hypothetical protein